jgi:5-methylcytosine-specific restriction endonuclease McrA
MSRAVRVLAVVHTDRTFERREVRGASAWVGRCIHCSSALVVELDGTTAATIEHIEPSTHGGTDEVRNLALACARCNQRKGAKLDVRRRDDPTLSAVIETLRRRREERWREDPRRPPMAPEARSSRGRRR